MNILNDILYAKNQTCIVKFDWMDKTMDEFRKNQKNSQHCEPDPKRSKKIEMFKPQQIAGIALFETGLTLRFKNDMYANLRFHLSPDGTKKQVKKIAHLADRAELSGLHIVQHFDKIDLQTKLEKFKD
jgi:hypothetical protein